MTFRREKKAGGPTATHLIGTTSPDSGTELTWTSAIDSDLGPCPMRPPENTEAEVTMKGWLVNS